MPQLLIDLSSIDIHKHEQARKLLSDIDSAIKNKGADPFALEIIQVTYGDSDAWISGALTIKIDKSGTTLPNIDKEFQDLVDAYNDAKP